MANAGEARPVLFAGPEAGLKPIYTITMGQHMADIEGA
jgi:hypothetical protein